MKKKTSIEKLSWAEATGALSPVGVGAKYASGGGGDTSYTAQQKKDIEKQKKKK